MIKTFNDAESETIWKGLRSRKFPIDIQEVARRKLRMLNNAGNIYDLTIPPSNRLETLKGDRDGQHSIRINDKYRICFNWKNNDAYNVEIVDYH